LIFVQDEGTSHLDFGAEQDIQKRLLRKYEDTTMINISHRLLTISNYDKVLTVQNVETIEFGEPYLLLVERVGAMHITKKKGCFALAVINMGNKVANEIFRNAMVTYYDKHEFVLPQEEHPIISNNFFEDSSSSNSSEGEEKLTEKFKEKEIEKSPHFTQKLQFQLQMQNRNENKRERFKSKGSPNKLKDGRRKSKLERKSFHEIAHENLKRFLFLQCQI